ncbi:MAG: molybdenum cofactor guanylyltransferase [bacterium]|nr:molybdenum cofactor guanylyltransferase [bacterium]
MPKIKNVTGAILAGGKSTRFKRNKAFAIFNGVSFIDRTLVTMKTVFEEVIIVTNTPEVYSGFGVPVLGDTIPYQGPIGGLMSALSYLSHRPVFIAACDMPLLNPAVIRKIIKQGRNSLAAVPVHDGRKEYLMAFYSQKILPLISLMIGEERLSMTGLVSRLEPVAWVPVQGESWFNVNTPEDLSSLEELHAS